MPHWIQSLERDSQGLARVKREPRQLTVEVHSVSRKRMSGRGGSDSPGAPRRSEVRTLNSQFRLKKVLLPSSSQVHDTERDDQLGGLIFKPPDAASFLVV